MKETSIVRQFIVDHFLFGEAGTVENTTPLFESGLLDSTGILDVVAFIEKQWGIRVADEELVPDNFSDLEKIGMYLRRKVGSEEPCAESQGSAI